MKNKERIVCYSLIALLFAALIVTVTALSTGAFTTREIQKYDLNNDARVTVADVSTLLDALSTGGGKPVYLTDEKLLDKIEGGWIGQMAGVTWGASTEFCWAGRLIPLTAIPSWSPSMINNAFSQDDLYVEIPFLDVMGDKGFDCDPADLAAAFRDTGFALWHANGMARENLKNGIPYPQSGSYLENYHCDDIDWQIECDFLGMIYPGLPNEAAARAFELGHIMNYGDGVYGGVFISAMHAAAFTASSVEEICEAGIDVIPEGTLFRELLDDVMASWRAGDSFEKNWNMLETKYAPYDLCPELPGISNIDAKLNSGYVLLGLLYGYGDFEQTMLLSMRCGQDSDCNPSSAASILGNYLGASNIPDKYKSALDRTTAKFYATQYNYSDTVALNNRLMLDQLRCAGVGKNQGGVWCFYKEEPIPVPFEQWPDGVYVFFRTAVNGNTVSFTEVTPYAKNEDIASYTIDMGDGRVFNDVTPVTYTYEQAGTYTVTVTVTGENGSVASKSAEVRATRNQPGANDTVIVCSVTSPAGGGSRNAGVICDGVIPTASSPDSMQYDTYALSDPHGDPEKAAYIGYVYKTPRTVSQVVFTEGNHFGNGGWFGNGAPTVEVLQNGVWTAVQATVSPAYPNANYKSAFGNPYETFTFTLQESMTVDGVRLFGLAGGSAGFISVGELSIG